MQVLSECSFIHREPGADYYMEHVTTCSYRKGKLERYDGRGYHKFPVIVKSDGGELLQSSATDHDQYDVVVSINVVEHVQDAFAYLMGLYKALKPGGTLIFHERYYSGDGILNGDKYHPVRITQQVLDLFLSPSNFHIIYNNCSASYANRRGEQGYYVIAEKL
jgi:hypothetical protein